MLKINKFLIIFTITYVTEIIIPVWWKYYIVECYYVAPKFCIQ